MAQNVVINNITYSDVPQVQIPKSGGGTAKFIDPSDATLTSGSQLLNGIKSHDADGVLITGNIPSKSSSDLTASGATVTAPAGYYASAASKTVTSGSVTAPATISGTSASVSTGTNTLTLTKSVSVTPNVTTAGYISSGTAGSSSVSLTASVTTKAAATITPGTSNQEIAASTYLTGKQTVLGDANLVAGNIKQGVSIFNIAGTLSSVAVSQDSVTKVLSIS